MMSLVKREKKFGHMRSAFLLITLILSQLSYGANSDDGLVDKMIGLGDHNVHIRCQGTGRPTVILEAGSGTDLKTWATIQPKIAKFTRVCSYSRAGLGKSTLPPGETQLDAVATVKDLHDLLQNPMIKLNSPPPYILVGHSYGGLYTRFFLDAYPNEVAGMVLLDATSGNMGMKGFGLSDELIDQLIIYLTKKQLYFKKHPALNEQALFSNLNKNKKIIHGIKNQTLPSGFIERLHKEISLEKKDMDELERIKKQAKRPLANKPLFIVVAGRHEMLDFFNRFHHDKDIASQIVKKKYLPQFYKMLRQDTQPSLKKSFSEKKSMLSMSKIGVIKKAHNSGHVIYIDQPKIVIDAIKSCVSYY